MNCPVGVEVKKVRYGGDFQHAQGPLDRTYPGVSKMSIKIATGLAIVASAFIDDAAAFSAPAR